MEGIEWNVVNEGQLLDAMVGHKPVGVNKHFQMALICDKFAENLRKDVDPQKIWAHLETMYNLEALDENESIPFPNNEKEFSLPDSEFGELLNKKDDEVASDSSKSSKEPKKEETKAPVKNPKEAAVSRRDSKEGKDNNKNPPNNKKEVKKELEKGAKQVGKSRNSTASKEEKGKGKNEDTPKPKRTRGSLKPNDDSGSSGKSSPITVTPTSGKRRRIV